MGTTRQQQSTPDQQPAPAHLLAAGMKAPDFELPSGPGKKLSLSAFFGRPVVLAFYPSDWSPVCGDELAIYNEILDELDRFDAQLLGISVDGVWCHAAFARHLKLQFPLLADFHPKGDVARLYGAYRFSHGVTERALFVIKPDGVIGWSYLSPVDVNPGGDGILEALEALAPLEARASR